jgi:phosphoribosylamine--glycine ligase
VQRNVLQPTVDEMKRRGTPFAGLLYAGLALTSRGVKVIEFNARFGDPETQALLARLQTPLGQLLHAAATGQLAAQPALAWAEGAAVAVVLGAEGYPQDPVIGAVIHGADGPLADGAHIIQAGTALDDQGRLLSAGGRVLAVVGTGADLAAARNAAYASIAQIRLSGSFYRSDIAQVAAESAGS